MSKKPTKAQIKAYLNAAEAGDLSMVKKFIDAGHDVDVQSESGWTGLMLAAANDEIDVVKMLIAAGADPELQNKKGQNASQLCETPECQNALLSGSPAAPPAPPKSVASAVASSVGLPLPLSKAKQPTQDQANAFVEAAMYGKTKLDKVKQYIAEGYDVNAKNSFGDTALIVAIDSNSTSSLDTVKALLNAGADVKAKSPDGDTAFDLCSTQACEDLIKGAMNKVAGPAATVGPVASASVGLPPVFAKKQPTKAQADAFVNAAQKGNINFINQYIADGYDVNVKEDTEDDEDNNGSTALIVASQLPIYLKLNSLPDTFALDTVKALLAAPGIDVNAKDKYGNTALLTAVYSDEPSSLDIIKALLDAGADVNVKNDFEDTALGMCMLPECKKLIAAAMNKVAGPAASVGLPVANDDDIIRTILEDSRKYISRLSQQSKDIIRKYTGSDYKGMNKCLRSENNAQSAQCNAELAVLDRVITNGPTLKTPITLLRSFASDKDESLQLWNLLKQLKPGEIFEERAFMSTSYKTPAENFVGSKCCIMEIAVPVGVTLLAVESVGQYGAKEREILLSPGMGLRFVEESADSKGRTVYRFECAYCLPGQRFRSSVAPTHLLNVRPYRAPKTAATKQRPTDVPPPRNLPGTTRVEMKFAQKAREGWFKPNTFGERVYDYVVDQSTSPDLVQNIADEFMPTQAIFVRGSVSPALAQALQQAGYKDLFAGAQLSWFYNFEKIPVLAKYVYNGTLMVDFLSEPETASWLYSTRKPKLTEASKKIYKLGNIERLKTMLGCDLFVDSCIGSIRDYIKEEGYSVTQPLKQYLILARQHLNALFKRVLYPALAEAGADVPYFVAGTTAVNYWIQTLGGAGLPVIPTEDYDIKLADMSQVSVFEAALKNPLSTINAEQLLAELNKRSDTPIQSVDFEWVDMKNVPGGRRLLAKLRVPAHTAQTGREFFSYPIVEFSPGVKADSIDDYRYRTANGVYVASPEYIKEDMCKVWPTSGKSKAPRREAKYKYWNLVFPAGHRLHQPKAFQCDK